MPAWRSFDDGSTLAARLHTLRTGGRGGGGGGGFGGFGVGSSSISGGARSVTASTTFRKRSQFTNDFLARLDRIDTLGGLDAEGDHVGHSGCVNALAWSPSGDKLATGSDDQNIILWRFGTRHLHPSATRTSREDRSEDRHFPELDMGMSDVIQTGHRGNIFSVKWAPNSSDSRLFSCAGDSTVRVFDLNRASSSSFRDEHTNAGREYRQWPRDNGVCTRVLRCHKSRAKRISTENSPDVFLTCAEDGEVRQMDLRLPHTCGPSQGYGHGCPRPLVAYNMELYSLSVSKMEPWLFCVAGTSAQAYLHDRRMIPRLLSAEWGATIDSENVARTQCVRRFARPPYEYSAAREEAEEEEEDEEGEGGPTLHREGADGEARMEARRRRQRKWERAHITAVKISESNGRDLLASYSGDAVYKFDLKGEPNVIHGRDSDADASIDGKGKGTMRSSKRKKGSHSPPRRSDGWEFASLAKRKMSRGVDVKRLQRRATAILFPRPAQLSSARFDAALLELDELEKATEQSLENGGGGVADGAVARLCRTLLVLHSSRRSQEDDDEQGPGQVQGDVVDVEHAKLVLGQAREHVLLRDEFVPLLDELEEAVNWNATGQIEKLEATLWETAQEIVKRAWGEDSFTGPERIQVVDEERSHLEKLAAEESEASVSGEEEVLEKDTLEEDTHEEEAEERGQVDMPMARFLRDDVLQRAQAMDEDEEDGGGDGEEGEEMSIQEDEDSELDSEAYDISIERASDDDDDGGDLDESVGGKSPIVYPVARYAGHANNETVKDCGFLGPNDEHVWSGSDSGHFFVWDNIDERLKALFKGDDCVTNVVQPHPLLPVLAASGIDDTVKLFGPVGPGSRKLADRLKDREDIIRKNRKQRRGGAGINSRAIMQLFASHIMREQGGEGGATRVVNADGEEEECVVM